MRRVAAPLAAALVALALAGCGGDGAEPGAPEGATLVLDFQPNAVHAGIYAAVREGMFESEGIELTIREPSTTSDSAKLLEAGRADFAIMDINDFGIARERGLDIVAFAAIVQRPLASVIARDRNEIRAPADLAGKTIGVTGVPSDDAVLDTVLAAGGVDPGSVDRKTIGFNAVQALAAGRIDAATSFWNAEGVQLRDLGVPTREFRVDRFGAPRYPELVLVTSRDYAVRESIEREESDGEVGAVCAVDRGLVRGYSLLGDDPDQALDDLTREVGGLDRASQEAQLDALIAADAFSPRGDEALPTPRLSRARATEWRRWASTRGLIADAARSAARVEAGFRPTSSAFPSCLPA
jgi:NitT/TauT family transport system substrate-binding protein/putative hydroxymethylpyrimidine transport system substrate-binding protein